MRAATASASTEARRLSRARLAFTLALLFAINVVNFYDRQVVGAIGEVIKRDWQLSDAQLAGLTTAFVLLYAVVGVPLGKWADCGPRRVILGAGVIVWSAFTALCGTAGSFAALVLYRLGVGVGEASAAPTANSLIGDLVPPHQRARAISVFMLGLPVGLAASYVVSGLVTRATGSWRAALLVAAAPGFALGILAFFLPEPRRGAADAGVADTPAHGRATIAGVLHVSTMWWVIASGALFNLALYALSAFTTSYLVRFHGLDIDHANRFSGAIYGLGGGIGLLLGGWVGDRVARRGPEGRMRAAALANLLAAPIAWLALAQPQGAPWPFALLMFAACAVLYVYYATVYATVHDVIPPRARGTAMAVYFLVFYAFTAIGLVVFGRLSDALAARALQDGASLTASRALGLHGAMYAIPTICVTLVPILWAGGRAAGRDYRRLHGPSSHA